ncbi:MAG: hypothetical protein GX804_08375, partial [Lentisphaerae bacterium]|nr:hypothetical protein [Lentisphaerota bacterium]
TYNQYLTPYVTMPFPHWADDAADVAGLRREMSLALINGASLWWFDMWGGYYQTEVIFDNFRLMSEIWDEYAGKQEKSVAEIAMVIDPDGCYYLHPTDSDRNAWKNGMQEDSFLHGIRDKLNRVGAPYDIISFNDIAEMPDFERYKLVVFCTPFEIDQRKLEQLNKHVLRDNRHIVWLYAPGISDGSNWVPEQMQKLAGVEFGTPGVNRVDKESWQSVHVATPKDLTIDLLKELAAQSGVNIYCEEQTPVYANTRLLAVHSAEGGKIRIKLPRPVKTVLEVFSKTVITCDASGFEYDFPTPGTCLFDLEAK